MNLEQKLRDKFTTVGTFHNLWNNTASVDEVIKFINEHYKPKLANVDQRVMPKIADRTLIAQVRDNKITLQKANYVEDGNLIKIDGNKIELYEIPCGGGYENFVGKFNTIIEAIAEGDTLT